MEGFPNRHQVNDFIKTAYIFGITHFTTDVWYTFILILLFILHSIGISGFLGFFFFFFFFTDLAGSIIQTMLQELLFFFRPGLFGAGFRQSTKSRRSWSSTFNFLRSLFSHSGGQIFGHEVYALMLFQVFHVMQTCTAMISFSVYRRELWPWETGVSSHIQFLIYITNLLIPDDTAKTLRSSHLSRLANL